MNHKLAALGFCILLAMPLYSAAPAAAHDAPNRCGAKHGTGAGWWKVRGHNVRCKKARRVARRWEQKCVANGCPRRRATRIHVRPGYRCRYRDAGHESVKVRCTAEGNRVVHFFWGS